MVSRQPQIFFIGKGGFVTVEQAAVKRKMGEDRQYYSSLASTTFLSSSVALLTNKVISWRTMGTGTEPLSLSLTNPWHLLVLCPTEPTASLWLCTEIKCFNTLNYFCPQLIKCSIPVIIVGKEPPANGNFPSPINFLLEGLYLFPIVIDSWNLSQYGLKLGTSCIRN